MSMPFLEGSSSNSSSVFAVSHLNTETWFPRISASLSGCLLHHIRLTSHKLKFLIFLQTFYAFVTFKK